MSLSPLWPVTRHNTEICISRIEILFRPTPTLTVIKEISRNRTPVQTPPPSSPIETVHPGILQTSLTILSEPSTTPAIRRSDGTPSPTISPGRLFPIFPSKTVTAGIKQPPFRGGSRLPVHSRVPCSSPTRTVRKRISKPTYIRPGCILIQTPRENKGLLKCPRFPTLI